MKKINFKELTYLDLSYNKISDINVLKKTKFEKLKTLKINNNLTTEEENASILS